jgi:hypothetical protein
MFFRRYLRIIFVNMARLFLLLNLLLFAGVSYAQVRVSKLVIESHQIFELKNSDILVADTLIMQDSSTIVLNKLKRENYIRAQVAIIGNNCTIDGRGISGQQGRDGAPGSTPFGPCTDGSPGRNGGKGLDGTPGVNLFLYLEDVALDGKLIIDLAGGDGGKGGNGGSGGGGSPGTVHCNGGNGGNGGNAGPGGNGADGGTLTLSSKSNPFISNYVGSKINVYTHGGLPGDQGNVGSRGPAGLGPSRKNGKNGEPGLEAPNGLAGINGKVNFEKN